MARNGAAALFLPLAIGLALAGTEPPPAAAQDPYSATVEYVLLVESERAPLRVIPRDSGGTLMSFSRGAMLSSFLRQSGWYRVVAEVGEGGVVVVGWVSSEDVLLVGRRTHEPWNLWARLDREFHGIGLSFRVATGGAGLPGGELMRGTENFFDITDDGMLRNGWTLFEEARDFRLKPFLISLDAYYDLSPRLGIVAGVGRLEHTGSSYKIIEWMNYYDLRMNFQASLRLVPLRLGVFYRQPLVGPLSAYGEAGALLVFARYAIAVEQEWNRFQCSIQARSRAWGGFGALGLELALTSRGSIFLEARGDAARFRRFEGKDVTGYWNVRPGNVQVPVTVEGRLYYSSYWGIPVLEIRQTPLEPAYGHEVELRLRSLAIAGGLRLKF